VKLSYRDLGQGISCIEAYYQRPHLACCYLLIEDGEAAILDTGATNTAPMVMELLARKGLTPEQVKYVIPTHVHLDHAGGAGELMALLPNAQLVVHPAGARHMIDPSRLIAGATAVYGEAQFKRDYGSLTPVEASRVIKASDGFTLALGSRSLLCLDTPGHARHHICIWDERSKGFFTGDTFGIVYPELTTDQGAFIFLPSTPVQFDPDAWRQTIERLMSYQPERMYLTHYGSVDAPAPLAERLHQEIDAYVEIAEGCDPENRYPSLFSALSSYYRSALERHGCDLSGSLFEDILHMDIGLCAQGLEVWLQRRQQHKE